MQKCDDKHVLQANMANCHLRIITGKNSETTSITSLMRVDIEYIAISYFQLWRAIYFNRIELFPDWHRWHFEHGDAAEESFSRMYS